MSPTAVFSLAAVPVQPTSAVSQPGPAVGGVPGVVVIGWVPEGYTGVLPVHHPRTHI